MAATAAVASPAARTRGRKDHAGLKADELAHEQPDRPGRQAQLSGHDCGGRAHATPGAAENERQSDADGERDAVCEQQLSVQAKAEECIREDRRHQCDSKAERLDSEHVGGVREVGPGNDGDGERRADGEDDGEARAEDRGRPEGAVYPVGEPVVIVTGRPRENRQQHADGQLRDDHEHLDDPERRRVETRLPLRRDEGHEHDRDAEVEKSRSRGESVRHDIAKERSPTARPKRGRQCDLAVDEEDRPDDGREGDGNRNREERRASQDRPTRTRAREPPWRLAGRRRSPSPSPTAGSRPREPQ